MFAYLVDTFAWNIAYTPNIERYTVLYSTTTSTGWPKK